MDLGEPGYLASDGKVVITRPWITVGAKEDHVSAVDTNSCTVLWDIPIPMGDDRIYRRGNTIVQNSNTELKQIVVS
ncbi:Uncharacterised protein [Mycobacteroides abscessus subsp. massiliense]|nr:Uncharacterised protein [Mycobacteroides abscessus subsp. massiliense]